MGRFRSYAVHLQKHCGGDQAEEWKTDVSLSPPFSVGRMKDFAIIFIRRIVTFDFPFSWGLEIMMLWKAMLLYCTE